MALKHVNSPYTQQGTKLALSDELEKSCKVLYKITNDNIYEFAGIYDPEIPDEDYPDGMIALSVRSVLHGVERITAGTNVLNVIGSTGDTWYGKSNPNWINVWTTVLTENGYPHPIQCYVRGGPNCNARMCGGHMVLANNSPTPAHGTNGTVFIIPICNAHNNYRNRQVMTVTADVWAVVLDRYHQ